MKKLVSLLALVLVFPSSALAKDLKRATVCGASGCTDITALGWENAPIGGDETIDAPPPAPFYTATFVLGEPGHPADNNRFTLYYVPKARAIAGNGEVPGNLTWFPVRGAAAVRFVEQATAGQAPFAAPREWPHAIKSPRSLLGGKPAVTTAKAKRASFAASSRPAAETRGWSSWFLLPILALALTGAAALALRRRRIATRGRRYAISSVRSSWLPPGSGDS